MTENLQETQTEVQLTDGVTESIPEVTQPQESNVLQAGYGQTTMEFDDKYYSRGEFSAAFNEFLIFLKSPEASIDTFETLRAQGQELAADKIYSMAEKYNFMRWIIDRRTAFMHDMALISIFATCEVNAIVYNWTGISLAEKGKIWLKNKIKQRAASVAAQSGKRSVWGFLGRRDQAKQQKPEKSQQD